VRLAPLQQPVGHGFCSQGFRYRQVTSHAKQLDERDGSTMAGRDLLGEQPYRVTRRRRRDPRRRWTWLLREQHVEIRRRRGGRSDADDYERRLPCEFRTSRGVLLIADVNRKQRRRRAVRYQALTQDGHRLVGGQDLIRAHRGTIAKLRRDAQVSTERSLYSRRIKDSDSTDSPADTFDDRPPSGPGPSEAPDEPIKQRIYRVATELFASNGYHATGVQALTDAVGLGRGALYYHIRRKENLLYEISLSLLRQMLGEAEQVALLELSPEEKLRKLARDLLRNLSEHRAGWTVSLYESRALSPELRRDVVEARDAYEQVWARVLEEGSEVSAWGPVTPLVLRGVLGLMNSTHLWIENEGPLPPEDIADVYVELLLDGLRPRFSSTGPPRR
jgi:TetR/AcrR family transcriptional regulator, cholesterol catabolism regulator